MNRETIRDFLIEQKDKSKSKKQVLSSFTNLCITNGIRLDKLAKLIADLRSYPEWTWGE